MYLSEILLLLIYPLVIIVSYYAVKWGIKKFEEKYEDQTN